MDPGKRAEVEAKIRVDCEGNRFDDAAKKALEAYGSEVFGFLLACAKDSNGADDAFSLFSEKLWRGLSSFNWQSSLRTWAYTIARRCLLDLQQGEAQHRRGRIPIEGVEEIAERVRTKTLSLFAQQKMDAFAKLRAELPEDDRMLLVLRVDESRDWQEIATILDTPEDQLVRETARLRKRFQLIKERLRFLGKARGLLTE